MRVIPFIVAIFLVGWLNAQTVNPPVQILPAGATADDEITLVVDLSKQCVGTLGTEFIEGDDMYMHIGVGTEVDFNGNDPGSRGEAWGYVVSAIEIDSPNPAAQLDYMGNGIYQKTFVPRFFFGVPPETPITRLSMVFNNGTWDRKVEGQGKFDNAPPQFRYDWCGDIFLEFDEYKGTGFYSNIDTAYVNSISACNLKPREIICADEEYTLTDLTQLLDLTIEGSLVDSYSVLTDDTVNTSGMIADTLRFDYMLSEYYCGLESLPVEFIVSSGSGLQDLGTDSVCSSMVNDYIIENWTDLPGDLYLNGEEFNSHKILTGANELLYVHQHNCGVDSAITNLFVYGDPIEIQASTDGIDFSDVNTFYLIEGDTLWLTTNSGEVIWNDSVSGSAFKWVGGQVGNEALITAKKQIDGPEECWLSDELIVITTEKPRLANKSGIDSDWFADFFNDTLPVSGGDGLVLVYSHSSEFEIQRDIENSRLLVDAQIPTLVDCQNDNSCNYETIIDVMVQQSEGGVPGSVDLSNGNVQLSVEIENLDPDSLLRIQFLLLDGNGNQAEIQYQDTNLIAATYLYEWKTWRWTQFMAPVYSEETKQFTFDFTNAFEASVEHEFPWSCVYPANCPYVSDLFNFTDVRGLRMKVNAGAGNSYEYMEGNDLGSTSITGFNGQFAINYIELTGSGSAVADSQEDQYVVSGAVISDYDGDGDIDGYDDPLPNMPVLLLPDSITRWTNAEGYYEFEVAPDGIYKVKWLGDDDWELTSDQMMYDVAYNMPEKNGLDFLAKPILDTAIVVLDNTSMPTRCGFTVGSRLSYTNIGTVMAEGELVYVADTLTEIISTSPEPSFIDQSGVYHWDLEGLAPGYRRAIRIERQMPGVDAIGDTLLDILGFVHDDGREDVLYSEFPITCAYDPNDIAVSPSGIREENFTLFTEDELTYKIRFQNTGNDTAFNIVIVDTLSSALDFNSLKVIGSSHELWTEIDASGVVKFHFENILLPDSIVDEPNSHGFVSFFINTKPKMEEYTVVQNTAHIFFDFNPAIVTNTVFNTYVSSYPLILDSENVEKGLSKDWKIYPTPVQDISILEFRNPNADKYTFQMLDLTGRVVNQLNGITSNIVEIAVRNHPSGLYTFQLVNEDRDTSVRGKVLISR